MRILYWTDLFWPYLGGTEVLGSLLLPALRARGHDVTVVTSHDSLELPDEDEFAGVRIRRLPFRRAIARRDMAAIASACRLAGRLKHELDPDVIHLASVGTSGFFHLRTLAAHPAPAVVTLQQELLSSQAAGEGSVLRELLWRAGWVTAVSAAVLAQARRLVPTVTPRSSVVYNVAPPPDGEPPPLPFAPPRLLCLGRLVPAKGFDVALTAFALVHRRFPTARLVVAGDGQERPALEAHAARLGIKDDVVFTGWVAPPDVPALIATATAVLMPSRREGLPLVAVQAALMGRPVVGTPVGGLPEVVVHERTGLVVPRDDAAALAAAIGRLLCDPEKARRLGASARRHAMSRFDPAACIDRYEAVYRTLLDHSARPEAR